jgi:peptidoglycan/LPS O-acetylase OafA/YrhL
MMPDKPGGYAASVNTDSGVSSTAGRLRAVDGLRGLSIGLVIFGHASGTLSVMPQWLIPGMLVVGNAGLGVSFFFVISGYLITNLLLRELETSGHLSFYNFYVRRATRIFPAFYVYLAFIGTLSLLRVVTVSPTDLIISGCYLWNYLPMASGTWWLGQTWSLCIEEQFYLLWPLTLVLLGRRNAGRVAIFIVCAEPFIRVLTYLVWPSYRGRIDIMLHTRADILMFGCLLALSKNTDVFHRALARLSQTLYLSLVAIFLFLIDPLLRAHFRGVYILPFGLTLQGFGIALIVFTVLQRPGSLIATLLRTRVLVWTGLISYSLYLWQQVFLTPLNRTVTGKLPINLVFAFVVAATSYYWVEKPILRMRPKLLRESKQMPAADRTLEK